MALLKLAVVASLAVLAQAIYVPPHLVGAPQDPHYNPNPQYSYGYSVSDPLTGDSKNQQETRSGDVVQGSYSLVEPDGTVRTVNYAADDVSGFNAVVERTPPAATAPVIAPAPVVPAPAPVRYALPAYAAAPYGGIHAYSPYAAPLARAYAGYSSPYVSYAH